MLLQKGSGHTLPLQPPAVIASKSGGLKPSGIAVIHCHSCKLARGPEVPKSNTKSRLRVSPISPFQAVDDSGADCTQGERPRVTKPVDRVPEDEDTDRRGPPVPVIIIRRRAVWVKSNVRYPFLWSNTSRGSQPRPHRTPRRSRAVIRWGQSITDPVRLPCDSELHCGGLPFLSRCHQPATERFPVRSGLERSGD